MPTADSVSAKSFEDMTLDELRQAHQSLRDELLENDGELARRRARPSGDHGMQPIAHYQEWRGQKVARQNELRSDLQYVKGLIAEKSREEYAGRWKDTNGRWRRRCAYLNDVLAEIEADTTATESIRSLVRRARLHLAEDDARARGG